MRSSLAQIFALASVELVLPLVRKGRKGREGLQGVRRQRDVAGDKSIALLGPAAASVG